MNDNGQTPVPVNVNVNGNGGEGTSSLLLKRNAKGDVYWEIKLYQNDTDKLLKETLALDAKLQKKYYGNGGTTTETSQEAA